METSAVRHRVNTVIEEARREAGERRTRNDEAERAYKRFLDRIAIPVLRQVADTLKASHYPFSVFTPGGSVRLMSDKSPEDFIELVLDTSGSRPVVMGHTSRARGRRVVEAERAIAEHAVADLTDEHVLTFVLAELRPYVER